ncbi:MAG TPA: Mth938-like domain-containing protein [Gammaproteobacteria bacterium]|nr:Mth938-like domain-containing protein [Gammaproteobacteria bacterium]
MKITLEASQGNYSIQSYAAGQICVSAHPSVTKETLTQSCIILPDRILRDWPPQSFTDLRAEHFAVLLELKPEIVVLGSGDRLRFPAPALTTKLFEQGIGVEVMDTGAACRTYNILINEGRRVAAALLMI